jgi:ABC-type nitrate/sulfonate/bicarbonate transport system substrate-binding protein
MGLNKNEVLMSGKTDFIDIINIVRDRLRLLQLAAGSLEDRDDSNAIQLGVSDVIEAVEDLKNRVVAITEGSAE